MAEEVTKMEELIQRVKELELEGADQEALDELAAEMGEAVGRLFGQLSRDIGQPLEQGFLFGFKDSYGSGWVNALAALAEEASRISETLGEKDDEER